MDSGWNETPWGLYQSGTFNIAGADTGAPQSSGIFGKSHPLIRDFPGGIYHPGTEFRLFPVHETQFLKISLVPGKSSCCRIAPLITITTTKMELQIPLEITASFVAAETEKVERKRSMTQDRPLRLLRLTSWDSSAAAVTSADFLISSILFMTFAFPLSQDDTVLNLKCNASKKQLRRFGKCHQLSCWNQRLQPETQTDFR